MFADLLFTILSNEIGLIKWCCRGGEEKAFVKTNPPLTHSGEIDQRNRNFNTLDYFNTNIDSL